MTVIRNTRKAILLTKNGNKCNTKSGWENSLLASYAVDTEPVEITASFPITHKAHTFIIKLPNFMLPRRMLSTSYNLKVFDVVKTCSF